MMTRIIPLATAAVLAVLSLCPSPAAAQGRWITAYPEVRTPVHANIRQSSQRADRLRQMLGGIGEFDFPRDVTLEMAECGVPGAFYQPERPAVQICYELLMKLYGELNTRPKGDEQLAFAIAVILVHQLGHVLVDELELPVGVPAEEAADQFIAYIEGASEDGPALPSMLRGLITVHELGIDWEHPGSASSGTRLDAARMEKLACLFYGVAPRTHGWVVSEGRLTASRAQACIAESRGVKARWDEMLDPHIRG